MKVTAQSSSPHNTPALKIAPTATPIQMMVNLLRELEALNWNQNAPIKSRTAVKAALRAAASLPEREFDQFAAVLTDWLTAPILGFTLDLDEFEAHVSRRAARSNREFRRFLAQVSG